METRELTCIGCPLGCALTVTMNGKEVVEVKGNTCKKGDIYARKEVTNPTRIVTTTVRVSGGAAPMINVKTQSDIPKDKIFECVAALKGVTIQAPVAIGDVVLENVAGTGVNIVGCMHTTVFLIEILYLKGTALLPSSDTGSGTVR